ncbi:MAG: type II toxin-antitoxin system HicA family toxin [Armatimonadetes bacterium]|nr:type II toxin-antitoxin system HicA family toxin [Armatimonadota bacterium]
MNKLPRITGRQVVAALKRLGFQEIRQKGSHVTLHKTKTSATCTVPVHAGETLKPKTLQSILKQAGITVEQLRRAL